MSGEQGYLGTVSGQGCVQGSHTEGRTVRGVRAQPRGGEPPRGERGTASESWSRKRRRAPPGEWAGGRAGNCLYTAREQISYMLREMKASFPRKSSYEYRKEETLLVFNKYI